MLLEHKLFKALSLLEIEQMKLDLLEQLLWLLDMDLLLLAIILFNNEVLKLLLDAEIMDVDLLLLPDFELLETISLELIELLHINITLLILL